MQRSSQQAAQALIEERGALRSLALALLRDVDAADEVVQEAMLAALGSSSAKVAARRPWLRTVVRNLAWKRIDRERGRSWREQVRARDTEEASVPSPEAHFARLEMHGQLNEALRELEEPYRSILMMRYYDDLTPAQIANQLGVPGGTVRWRLKAGLDQLRDQLDQRHGGDRVAWVSGLAPLIQLDAGAKPAGLATNLYLSYRSMSWLAQLTVLSLPAAAGVALWPDSESTQPVLEVLTAEAEAAPSPGSSPATNVIQEGRAPERRAAAETSSRLISDALHDYARKQLRAGWREELGTDPSPEQLAALLAEFEAVVKDQPFSIGRRGASDFAEAKAAGDAGGALHEILTLMDQGETDERTQWVLDGSKFAQAFKRVPGPSLDGTQHLKDASKVLVDGATMTLPPGVFRLENFMGDEFPRDVTLRGAGMNSTLVFIEELSTRGPLVNLGFVDLTLHTDNGYLFDLRREPASVLMDRVRLVGFDLGAGGSCAFGTKELALLARDSVFENGYGRHPQHGQIFDVRTPGLLARFERCRFDLTKLPFNRVRAGAKVVLDHCKIERDLSWQGPAPTLALLEQSQDIHLISTPIDFYYKDPRPDSVPSKDLGALFPNWESAQVR